MCGKIVRFCLAAVLVSLGASCAGSSRAPVSYDYSFDYGKTAVLQNGIAIAPPRAPAAVKAAIAAGNQIRFAPYQWGGGRGRPGDYGFDCSGATSHVLRAAGVLDGFGTSSTFKNYGKPGAGKWINVWARDGHVFLTVAGLRFDTGWHGEKGPRWATKSRPAKGYVLRHPAGL
ncbi:MAG: peptidoglycan endopeptidase [Verrucomicrobiae bacterium]|nr:peptidoglycan endopeptidase [Verrucomicrobiae bacterium]